MPGAYRIKHRKMKYDTATIKRASLCERLIFLFTGILPNYAQRAWEDVIYASKAMNEKEPNFDSKEKMWQYIERKFPRYYEGEDSRPDYIK